MIVLLTLTTAGSDTGPFDLYSDLDGFTVPFQVSVSKADLQAGYYAIVPDYTTIVRVKSTGICVNYGDIPLQNTTTTTTTSVVVPCNESVSSGGVGVTEYLIDLESTGGVFVIAFNAQSVPDKLELIHSGIKRATSGMTVPNEGPFDDLYGDPTVPTNAETAVVDQFIGSSKGTIPSRQTEFTTETGSSLLLPSGYQQLIWWQYDSTDYLINNKILVRVTGPSGTAWNLQRLCEVIPTTTTTSSTTEAPIGTTFNYRRDGSQIDGNPSFHVPYVDYIDVDNNPQRVYLSMFTDDCSDFVALYITDMRYAIEC